MFKSLRVPHTLVLLYGMILLAYVLTGVGEGIVRKKTKFLLRPSEAMTK